MLCCLGSQEACMVPKLSLPRRRRTKIVATIGPATRSPERVAEFIAAGVDVVRFNFSHGSREQHADTIEVVRRAASQAGRTVAILQDLQGPKIRVGGLLNHKPVRLEDGADVTITTDPEGGTAQRLSTTYPDIVRDVRPGSRILLDDGELELAVTSVDRSGVRARVIRGGQLGEHKGMNLPGVAISAPAMTEKDLEDLRFGLHLGVDFVALSFISKPEDLARARTAMNQIGINVPVIAKLERAEAMAQLDEIMAASDGVMVARGDLGVELPPERVPVLQKTIIRKANELGIPVITATQMLESMIENSRPTRAEASDVANAILDGTDAVMLSAETATGEFPIEAVEMMDRIATEVEATSPHMFNNLENRPRRMPIAEAVGAAACQLAEDLRAKAIVALTRGGQTAQIL
ncbi:MAG: pyruvate kinase, partial [Armatimonadetes bacterium]|nr:pyruvate kinase [Armatimonadota bacterium]